MAQVELVASKLIGRESYPRLATTECVHAGKNAIDIRALSFRRGRQWVLREVDLSVAGGEIVAILGANGAGKTTLLQCAAGILHCTTGEVRWHGEPANGAAARRRAIGFVGHESGLYLALTGRENLAFAARMHGLDHVSERVTEALDRFALSPHADHRVACLSRGMRQRLAIARGVIQRPSLLFLDEPFSGLDSESCAWLTTYFQEMRRAGGTLLFSSHEFDRVQAVADRLLVVEAGRLRCWTDPHATCAGALE